MSDAVRRESAVEYFKEVVEQAKKLVALADFDSCKDDSERIQFLYERIYQRPPRLEEIKLGLEFVDQSGEGCFEMRMGGVAGRPRRTGVKQVVEGGAPMSPEVARRVIALFREIRPPERASYDLTPHETRLLKLFVEGHNYKTAAAELGVTVHTVSFHLRSIYDKLQVHSKSSAVAKALRNRLV